MSPFGGEDPSAITNLVLELDSSTAQLGPSHLQTIAIANKLAVAFWSAGEVNRAVSLLDQALDRLAASFEPEHPVRIGTLCTLGQIMVAEEHWDQAAVVLAEVLELTVRLYGAAHAASLAVKGDLAGVLFELGRDREAAELERESLENARVHLGAKHPVTCGLAWNRVLRYERDGNTDSANALAANDLLWLLTEEDSCLDADQKEIRALLADRFNWQAAAVC